jgi:hypothetical protein
VAVPGIAKGLVDIWGNPQIRTGENFDATVNGYTDTKVELGGKVQEKKRIELLDEIWNKTGSSNKPYVILKKGVTNLAEDMLYYRVGGSHWRYVRD